MNNSDRQLAHFTFTLGWLSIFMLIFIMTAMPIYKGQVFLDRGSITIGAELIILIGFIILAMFMLVSIIWLIARIRHPPGNNKLYITTLLLGGICLILFVGEKVMVDEIGREYSLGWEVLGEWIILYLILMMQLFYNILILLLTYRSLPAHKYT